MVIKIAPTFTNAQIQKMLTERIQKLEEAIIANFRYIGEKFVKNARENGQYKDRTGNLRNSIGYVIMRNGVQIDENFRRTATVEVEIKNGKNKGKTRTTKGANDGVKAGQEAATQAAKQFPRGYVLIVVAGMDYAAVVESKGYDVITSSTVSAKEDLKVFLENLTKKVKNVR